MQQTVQLQNWEPFFYTRTLGQRASALGDLARFGRDFPMQACYKKRGRVDPIARSQMEGRAPAGWLGVGGLGAGVPRIGQDIHRG